MNQMSVNYLNLLYVPTLFSLACNLVTFGVRCWQYSSCVLARFRVTSHNRVVAPSVRWRDDVMLGCRSPGGLQSFVLLDNNRILQVIYSHKQNLQSGYSLSLLPTTPTKGCPIDTRCGMNGDTWINIYTSLPFPSAKKVVRWKRQTASISVE